jgi:NADH:ubiquinone reductase (H+-translocating)
METDGKKRIVILGGGFGGVYTARHLEDLLGGRDDVEVVLISRHNYFLMTPLLFEAGSGVLEPRHTVSPIRKLYRRNVRFVQGELERVDFERKTIYAQPPGDVGTYELEYDHLVIAVGGITNTSIIPGADRAMTFKVLADAIFLRNHAIELFERADVEPDPDRKRKFLTFVIAGGGLVGMELMGELTEFLKNLARSYPRIDPRDLRFELLEGGPQIMREMDRDLADYAVKVYEQRGVHFRTNCAVKRIEQAQGYHIVHLPSGETIEASTVIVAVGVKVNPLIDTFPLQKDRKGRVQTDATMLCKGRTDVWALGDCANIPDPQGNPYPQLAQHALRQARVLAGNILSSIAGRPLKPFVYETLGTLAALGHYNGIGKVKWLKLRGFAAWWVWRSYYLLQMPRWNRRIRIIIDWTIALLFKNDIVELDLFGERHPMTQTPGKIEPPVERIEPGPAASKSNAA